jgi:hypothetical protein
VHDHQSQAWFVLHSNLWASDVAATDFLPSSHDHGMNYEGPKADYALPV